MDQDSGQVDSLGETASQALDDAQMDAIVNAEAPSRDIPMRGPEKPAPSQEYTLKVDGKEVKAPIDKLLQWAQMGYQYPQKAAELNAQKEAFEKQRQEIESKYKDIESKWSPYKEVDEFAQKNPDWWAQVQQSYKEQAVQAQGGPEFAQLKQELEELKAFKQELSIEKQQQKIQAEDQKLNEDIKSVRDTYSNIDFDSPDESGQTLEMKVLKHALDNDIKSFKTAFRDYFHDQLVGKAKEEGKELVARELQKRTKLGILGESSKPTKGLKIAENVRSKSYNDLAQEALEEIQQL